MQHLYHQKMLRHDEQPLQALSNSEELKKIVKFRQRSSPGKVRRKSESILKKRNTITPQRKMTRVRSNFEAKNNFLLEQDCENQENNQMKKQQYLELLDSLPNKSFPYTNASIFSSNYHKKIGEGKIVWKRLPEIFGSKDLVLWAANSTGIIEKGTEYCSDYFPLALNCIRNNKALLRQLFQRQITIPQGIYYVKLFINCKWQYIIIDDCIPVLQTKKGLLTSYQPLFSNIQINKQRNKSIQIWYYLLEKAYAKVYSNYESIQKGNVSDFLTDLTGYPCSIYSLDYQKIKWPQLFNRFQALVIGLTLQRKIVSITKQAKNARVYFYLPQNSTKKVTAWPDELRKYFKEIFVWGENSYSYWGSSQIKQTTNQSIAVRSFKITQNMKCALNLLQRDQKSFPKHSSYQYSWIRFILLEKEFNGGYRWIQGDYNNSKALKIEVELSPGQYIAIIYPQWTQGSYPLSLIIKGHAPIKLIKQFYQQGTLEEGCADLAQRFGKFNQLSKFLCSYNCFHEEMGIIIENINNQKMKGQCKIRRVINGTGQENMKLVPFNKQFNNNILEVDIQANKCYTVILLTNEGINEQFMNNFTTKRDD